MTIRRDWRIFFSSVFFVLGFSLIFSLLGILLQTILSNFSFGVQIWLGRIGGIVIILFGLYMLGLINPRFMQKEYKINVKRNFGSGYLTSFVFGAAFAVGWTPCVSAALGAILALAATNAPSAFLLLLVYSFGLGIPFLIVGIFTAEAQRFISKSGKWLVYFQYVFGVIIILLGILIFAGQLSRVANFNGLTAILVNINGGISLGSEINSLNVINLSIAFLAGLASFLSPCVLPIIPGFLTYLASTAIKDETKQ